MVMMIGFIFGSAGMLGLFALMIALIFEPETEHLRELDALIEEKQQEIERLNRAWSWCYETE